MDPIQSKSASPTQQPNCNLRTTGTLSKRWLDFLLRTHGPVPGRGHFVMLRMDSIELWLGEWNGMEPSAILPRRKQSFWILKIILHGMAWHDAEEHETIYRFRHSIDSATLEAPKEAWQNKTNISNYGSFSRDAWEGPITEIVSCSNPFYNRHRKNWLWKKIWFIEPMQCIIIIHLSWCIGHKKKHACTWHEGMQGEHAKWIMKRWEDGESRQTVIHHEWRMCPSLSFRSVCFQPQCAHKKRKTEVLRKICEWPCHQTRAETSVATRWLDLTCVLVL